MNDTRLGRERGAASIEYAVVTLVIVMALFIPVGPDGSSMIDFLMNALRSFQLHSTYLMSLP